MPPHLTSDQVIQFLAEKKEKKLEAERAKELRKAEREAKKAERERQMTKREVQHSARGTTCRGRGRGTSRSGTSQMSNEGLLQIEGKLKILHQALQTALNLRVQNLQQLHVSQGLHQD